MNKKKIISNTILLTGTSFVIKILAYLYFILIAKKLENEQMGIFAILLTAYLVLELVANMGLDRILIRELAGSGPKKEKNILASAIVMKLLTGLAAYLLFLTGMSFLYPDISARYMTELLTFFLMVFPLVISRTIEAYFYAVEKMAIPAISQIAERIILLAGAVGVYYDIIDFTGFLILFPIAGSARLVIGGAQFEWNKFFIHLHIHINQMRALFKEARLMIAVEALTLLYFRIDIFMLSQMTDVGTTGIYHVVYKIFDCFIALFAGFLLAFFPYLSRKKEAANLTGIMASGFIFLLIVAGAVILFRDRILLFFRPEYLQGKTALTYLMLSLPVVYLNSIMANFAVVLEKTSLLLKMAVGMFSLNIILNYVLIPVFSLNGAALATLFCETVLVFGYFIILKGPLLQKNVSPFGNRIY